MNEWQHSEDLAIGSHFQHYGHVEMYSYGQCLANTVKM